MRRLRVLAVGVVTGSLLAAAVLAQVSSRIATTADALAESPVFFHGKQITVRRAVTEQDRMWRVSNTSKPIYVFWKDRPSLDADAEIRGEFWDVGRLEPNDSRFRDIDFSRMLEGAWHGQWPPRDRVLMITGATTVESPLPTEPTLRAIALAPEHYANRAVTVVGRFRGANLFGDLPRPAGKSRWDFVLQSADAAVWITGMRPRGKGFDLDVGARVDTGRWLQVTGTLRNEAALTWIEASAVSLSTAPAESTVDVSVPAVPRQPPPTVVFSAPLEGESDVDRAAPVRIQFSRDMDPRTIRDRIRVEYAAAAQPGGASAAPPPITYSYNEGSHSLEIRFAAPLDRFRRVKINLLEGIVSNLDNQPLGAWTLTFTTGG